MAYLKSLALSNFRNYSQAKLKLGPRINLFIGRNGQGKTNCLEAIALLIAGRSFRTPHLKELICHEQEGFGLEAKFERYEIEQDLQLSYTPQKKHLRYNETKYTSFIPLIGLLQGVYFSGYQNQLIKGAPSLRRRFLDLQCSQTDPLYLHHLRRYNQALKERNALLKVKKVSTLEFYEQLMAQSAPYLILQRQKALKALEELAVIKHTDLTQLQEPIAFSYQLPSCLQEQTLCPTLFQEALKAQRSKDLKLGFTGLGPHKDDFQFLLKGMDAKRFASEGQIQSLITSLYLAEYERLRSETGERPLFCIDDIGQNLDAKRLASLYALLDQMGQVFITTPELPHYSFQSPVRTFSISQGQLSLGCSTNLITN